jgi:diguanylate cyclase (GGDEF)-like protein
VAANRQAPVVDVSDVQLRLAMVTAGVWLTFAICTVGTAYTLATWDEQSRSVIVALFGGGYAGGALIALLPTDRIVRGRASEPFFICWSILDILLLAGIVAADGGGRSPFGYVFFLPLVFAALSYALPTFVAVGAIDVLAWVAVASPSASRASEVAFFAVCLATAAVMCAWVAQNQDRERSLLTVMSRSDPLTGSLNRRGFQERLESELSESRRTGQPLSLMVLDLDGFKAVNDKEGHAAGDELLGWIADTVRVALRTMDVVARLGGDEFAVLAPNAARTEADRLADRVRRAVSTRIGICTGVATFPDDGIDEERLHHKADRRLYEMKQGSSAKPHTGSRELSWAATLARAVNTRLGVDPNHSNVVRYATAIGRRCGWSGEDLESLRLAALMHDVGMVPVPDRILRKDGPLDPLEFEEVKQHAVRGAEMLGRVQGLMPIADWVRHSHEDFDGRGYPDGLSAEEIPLGARILRVASAFDAMTSDRPYRSAMSGEQAMEQLRRNRGAQFDPRCVELFEAYVAEEAEPVNA